MCPAGSNYTTCAPASFPSCSEPDVVEKHTGSCVEGCVCDNGFVWDMNQCVRPADCGCLRDSHYYEVRITIGEVQNTPDTHVLIVCYVLRCNAGHVIKLQACDIEMTNAMWCVPIGWRIIRQ